MRWNEQGELVDMTAHQQEMNLKKLKADWIYMCRFCQQAFSIVEGWYEHSHIPNGHHTICDVYHKESKKFIKTLGIANPDDPF